ncbi:MAG: insulinase family protein [Oscillospiraceae bacterium]|nr:insulinase family protein [Oscillospiraceae bacterium]
MNCKDVARLGERVYEAELPNGLSIRVVPKPGFSRKYALIAADYGSADTKFTLNGKTVTTPDGVAHYLEHKMFDTPKGDAMEQFAAMGASPNAFTSYDMTAYYFSCTEHFEENLRTLLEMVAVPCFTEESVEKERDIIGQEILMYEDSADSKLFEELFTAMFRHHPIRVPIAGTVQSIAQITAETLNTCFDAFYAPSNMMLCVVGDVDPAQVVRIAEELLPKDRKERPVPDYGPAETGECPCHESLRRMEVSMPSFALGFRCELPEDGWESLKWEIAADLGAELLAGESSALYQRLYEENLIDSDFSGGFECVRGVGLVSFTGDSAEPEAVRDALLEECERLLREGLDEDAFRRLKKSAVGRRIRDLDSFESICYRICANFFDGVDYFRFPEAYAEVTLEDVRLFLEKTVCPERMVLSVIEPKERD